ncbi:MAG: hypothetical protein JW867_02255 [Candidatus Omnitrophica bacterium]|nr:hypothetical protein [Candidatus Omnitrophota bacterium]
MNYQHKDLASGRWQTFSFFEQMANIGSEVERAIKWKQKNNPDYSKQACNRALELIDLTLEQKHRFSCLKELARVRESIVDYFYGQNLFKSDDKSWQKYFFNFTLAARRQH